MSCENCAQMEARLVQQVEDQNALNATLARESRRANALAAQLSAQHKADPRNDIVKEVLEHWQRATDSEKKKIPLDGKRAQLVRARLKDHTPVELKLAAEGYGHFPYVTDKGRSAEGTIAQRHDDAKLIYRDETMVEQGLKLLERWKGLSERGVASEPQLPQGAKGSDLRADAPRSLSLVTYRPTPLDRAVMALRDEFGVDRTGPIDFDERTDRYRAYLAPCPIQPASGSPMRVMEVGGARGPVEFACAHGCSPEDLFDAVRRVELRLDQRKAEAVSRARAA